MDKAGVRPLGLLEKLYTARHWLGLYHAIAVLSTYRTRNKYDIKQIEILFSAALAKVIERHPILSYAIHGEATKNPSYVLLDEIDLRQTLYFWQPASDKATLQQLESELDDRWSSQETVPPWKLVIIQDPNQDKQVFSVAFIYHHALADGLSGSAFIRSLSNTLNELAARPKLPSKRVDYVEANRSAPLTPPIEDLVTFNISWGFLIRQVLQEYGPSLLFGRQSTPYTGGPCEASELIPCRTKLHLLEIEAGRVEILLKCCKERNISMTSLLSLILVGALALALPSAEALTGSVPYTLRRVSGTSPNEMVNQTSALETRYPSDLLQRLRDPLATKGPLWAAASEHTKDLRTHLADCLTNNVVGLLPYVSDHHDFYKKKIGKKREQTFEVSNIGAIESSTTPDDSWTLERVIFAQCAAPVGPALALNVASVIDGPMTITFSWQDKIIEDDVIGDIIRHFEDMITKLGAS